MELHVPVHRLLAFLNISPGKGNRSIRDLFDIFHSQKKTFLNLEVIRTKRFLSACFENKNDSYHKASHCIKLAIRMYETYISQTSLHKFSDKLYCSSSRKTYCWPSRRWRHPAGTRLSLLKPIVGAIILLCN